MSKYAVVTGAGSGVGRAAALALLAIDQWFHLGIFGPKVPPI